MATAEKFGCCYQYLNFQCKFNTLVGLPFFVNRDFHPGTRVSVGLSYVYQYISELWVFLGLFSGIIALALVWNDVNVLFNCVSSTTHMTQIMLKIILLNWKKNEFIEQLGRLNGIFERNNLLKINDEIPEFGDFASNILRWVKRLEFAGTAVIAAWTSIYFLPYIYNSVFNYDSLDDANIPIIGYFPFNYTRAPAYQVVVVFQTVLFYFNNLKTIAINYFILGFVVIHVMHFRYLNLTLERASQILRNKQNGADISLDWRIDSFLINWIKQHQDSICAVKISVELLSLYFLVEFGYIVVHTCVPAFVMTSTLSWNLNQKIVLLFLCTISIFNLYLLALSGDIFTDSTEEFGITFYGPHLFDNNKSYRLIHRMMLFAGRNRSKVFGFSNLYPLCSVTFGVIMRMVMSCYLALNQIKGFKNDN